MTNLPPLSPDQEAVLSSVNDWLDNGDKQLLTLGGYAGTGKTTILGHLAHAHPDKVIAFVSLTGKAVSVMRKKLSDYGTVSTIHSFQYKPIIDPVSKEVVAWEHRSMASRGSIGGEDQIPHVDLIVNDEASMTSKDLCDDLLAYGRPMLAVGDHGQLPPVGDPFNLMEKPDLRLEKIHRQAEGNPILRVADIARRKGSLAIKDHSEHVRVVPAHNVPPEIERWFLDPDPDTLVITGANAQRVRINQTILARRGRQHFKMGVPQEGDRVVCLKNKHDIGLFNGAQATIKKVISVKQDFMEVVLQVDDFPNTTKCNMALWAFNEVKPKAPDKWVDGIPFDYGYCLTCHKAQGSEAKRVIVVGQGFGDQEMRRRWLYTAVTRAQEELYVLR